MFTKIKQFTSRISDCILSPITQNPTFFICQLLIMIIPFAYYNFAIGSNYKGVLMETFRILHIFIFDAYIFSIILLLFCKLFRSYVAKTILYFTSIVLFIFDFFVAIFYNSRISPVIIRLIRETNVDEINGFFTTLNSINFVYLCIAIVFLCSIIIIIEKITKKYFNVNSSNLISITHNSAGIIISKYIATILIVAICIFNIGRNALLSYAYINTQQITELTTNRYKVGFKSAETANTTYGHLIHSLFSDNIVRKDISILTNVLAQQYQTKCSYKSSKIILVIGESFSKYHSNLYNYKHNTNNLLINEVNKNNLFIFRDIITPYNATSYVMQQIFTFKNQDSDIYWAETPLFTKFFKESGYIVSFFSNQELKNNNEDIWATPNHFLVADQTRKYCITNTNLYKYRWDLDLISEYKSRIKHAPNESFLSIFHLNGQHIGYEGKYPSNEKGFSVEDYQYRTDLTHSQREMVAHYDNATAYNDRVIASIIDLYRDQDAIIIYLSDHGEEIHDYRNFIGRTPTAKLTPEICKYQFEIPFMIWMSDIYKENHPDVVKQVESSLDKPFMIDDLPHLMLDIAGIDCEWFDPTRSLINEKYNVNRKRLLLDTKVDYDEMIKQLN